MSVEDISCLVDCEQLFHCKQLHFIGGQNSLELKRILLISSGVRLPQKGGEAIANIIRASKELQVLSFGGILHPALHMLSKLLLVQVVKSAMLMWSPLHLH